MCMDGVVRAVNARVLGRGLVLVGAYGERFEVHQCSLQMMQH